MPPTLLSLSCVSTGKWLSHFFFMCPFQKLGGGGSHSTPHTFKNKKWSNLNFSLIKHCTIVSANSTMKLVSYHSPPPPVFLAPPAVVLWPTVWEPQLQGMIFQKCESQTSMEIWVNLFLFANTELWNSNMWFQHMNWLYSLRFPEELEESLQSMQQNSLTVTEKALSLLLGDI